MPSFAVLWAGRVLEVSDVSGPYHDNGTSVKPHRPIDAKTMLPMGSLLSAASQNAAPTRSRTGSTGSVPPCSWSLWLTSGSIKLDAGSTTTTSGPSRSSFRSMLATWLSMERRNPSSVKVQGSLVEFLRFPTAFTKRCVLFTTARGKPGWENSNEGRQMNMQPNSIKKLYLNFATCTQNLSMYICMHTYRYYTLRMYCLSESKAGTNVERNERLTRPHSQRLSESQTLHEHQLRQSRGAGPSIRATPPFPTPCNTNSGTDNNHCKFMKYYVAHCKVVSCHTTTYSKRGIAEPGGCLESSEIKNWSNKIAVNPMNVLWCNQSRCFLSMSKSHKIFQGHVNQF